MDIPSFLRPLGIAAGPLTVVALALMVVAATTAGPDVESAPAAIVSAALLLIALLGIATTAIIALARVRATGHGASAPAVAVLGAVLVAGGAWAALFVLPALSAEAPDLLRSGALGSVMVGYVASYAVFMLGWVGTAVALIRARVVPTWLVALVAVGGVASMVPAPEAVRLLIVSLAASVLTRPLAAATDRAPVAATAG